ncbi:MAG: hypothetical protein ACR2RA_09040 [Geminicoccaceae bacterium]
MQGVSSATNFAQALGGGGFGNLMSGPSAGLLNDVKGMLGQLMNKMGQDPAGSCCSGGMPDHGPAGGPYAPDIGGHNPRADNLHEKLAFDDFNKADKAKGSFVQSKAEAKKEYLDKGLDTLERDGYDVSQYRDLVDAAAGDSDKLNDIAEHMKGLLAPNLGDFAGADFKSDKLPFVGTINNLPIQS